MFSLSFVQNFIKTTLIAFYKQNDIFKVQKISIKRGEIIKVENLEFQLDDEFIKFINTSLMENTQTYISTIIDTFNQGCVDSCNHSKYKELEINIDNIKILCIKNKYSIFIGIYELNEFKKEMEKFKVDMIFSPYSVIDLNSKKTPNSLYILISEKNVVIVIYETDVPIYSSIYQFKIEDNKIENEKSDNGFDEFDDDLGIDDIEEIEGIDDIEDLDELESGIDSDLVEDIGDNLNNGNQTAKNDIEFMKNELEIAEFLKNSIKDYYENYSTNFLEHIYCIDKIDISDKILKELENELFLEIERIEINLLSSINELARIELDV